MKGGPINMAEDLAITIMRERVEAGVDIVKEIAEKNNIKFNDILLVKGVECGISLFIQKETARRVSGYQQK